MDEMEFVHYEVGKRLPREDIINGFKGSQGGGKLVYNHVEKVLSLYIGIPNPNNKEIKEFRNGLIRFALHSNLELDASLILICFGRNFIFDLLFDINTLEDSDGKLTGNSFNMFLFDSDTGIVKGIRTIGLGKTIMKELNQITRNDKRYTTEQYQSWVKSTYRYDLNTLWMMSRRVDWDR